MKKSIAIWTFVMVSAIAANALASQTVLVIVGAGGSEEYEQQFAETAEQWRHSTETSGGQFLRVGPPNDSEASDRETLLEILKSEAEEAVKPLWVVLIGHGTFDGKVAKFNLRGKDLSAAEFASRLDAFQRPLALINCSSASAPFINELSGPDRVIVTATKSGFQYNFARFGSFLASAINSQEADLDKDEQISLLEAFLLASARVAEFYEVESRLATENALVDDNGDGLGTLAEWFRGVRATRVAKDGSMPDGIRANQWFLVRSEAEQLLSDDARAKRDDLERQLERLRARKSELPEAEYYARLETILVPLAHIYSPKPK